MHYVCIMCILFFSHVVYIVNLRYEIKLENLKLGILVLLFFLNRHISKKYENIFCCNQIN